MLSIIHFAAYIKVSTDRLALVAAKIPTFAPCISSAPILYLQGVHYSELPLNCTDRISLLSHFMLNFHSSRHPPVTRDQHLLAINLSIYRIYLYIHIRLIYIAF